MYRIGLTGGVGSGKSTVSSYLRELGIPVIDGDEIARAAVAPGSSAMQEIRKHFGDELFLPDGHLDRLKMASIVFSDEDKRQVLNSIIHPFVWRRAHEELLKAQAKGHEVVVLDMPLLLEIGWQLRTEAVWVVSVPHEMQIERVMKRDNFTRKQVEERIAKQMPTVHKVNYADVVIDNSGTVEQTGEQVRKALKEIPGFHPPRGWTV